MIWNPATQQPQLTGLLIEENSVLRINETLPPIQIIGAPLCTRDGRAFGVVTSATAEPTRWRFARLADTATAASITPRHEVPLSRASQPLRITSLAPNNTSLRLSATPDERPRVEIHGIAGLVVFRARNRADDQTCRMLDPGFQRAVHARALDKLLPAADIAYTELGTLNVPVKVVDFPLLGQDQTGTCWVAHYREWLFYYLGTRHEYVPALEDLRSYLNLLVGPPTLERLFDPESRKAANKFNGSGPFAERNSVQMREHLDALFRSLLVGPETEPYVAFTKITRPYAELDADGRSRRFSEQEFGDVMEGLLLGQMTLGRSESHVMNILGFDGDEVMISTWQREFQGTLRQLARADKRGPLLMPLEFTQHPMVARAEDGNVVIPALDPAREPKLGALERRAVEKFNNGH